MKLITIANGVIVLKGNDVYFYDGNGYKKLQTLGKDKPHEA